MSLLRATSIAAAIAGTMVVLAPPTPANADWGRPYYNNGWYGPRPYYRPRAYAYAYPRTYYAPPVVYAPPPVYYAPPPPVYYSPGVSFGVTIR